MSEKVFILPLCLKDIFIGWRILGRPLYLSPFTDALSSPGSHFFQWEICCHPVFVSLHIMCLPSVATWKTFPLSLVLMNCAWGLLSFLDLWIYSFHQNWKFQSSLKYSSCLRLPVWELQWAYLLDAARLLWTSPCTTAWTLPKAATQGDPALTSFVLWVSIVTACLCLMSSAFKAVKPHIFSRFLVVSCGRVNTGLTPSCP